MDKHCSDSVMYIATLLGNYHRKKGCFAEYDAVRIFREVLARLVENKGNGIPFTSEEPLHLLNLWRVVGVKELISYRQATSHKYSRISSESPLKFLHK